MKGLMTKRLKFFVDALYQCNASPVNFAMNYLQNHVFREGTKTTLFYISLKQYGLTLAGMSKYYDEDEYLIFPNDGFEVTEIEENFDEDITLQFRKISLEELQQSFM